jgi:G3E family GTPase
LTLRRGPLVIADDPAILIDTELRSSIKLEFAQVVILNKIDLVTSDELNKTKALIQQLNPTAKLLTSNYSRIDLREILDTKMFDYTKAALSMEWLRSLNEVVKPETEEYGVGTFVYRARRPFSPKRLWKTIRNVSILISIVDTCL